MLRFLFVITICLLNSGFIYSQIRVRPVSGNAAASGTPGIYYTLPKTCLKVDITVNLKKFIPGPYAEFAGKYLGIDDVSESESTDYEITDVKMHAFNRPDPEQYYFVEYGEREIKEEQQLILSLTQAGMIAGINQPDEVKNAGKIIFEKEIELDDHENLFKYLSDYNLFEKIDTVTRKITIDTLTIEKHIFRSNWLTKNTEQKARDAADFISRIRENRFLLISGYQEVNYGESIVYMDQKLSELEAQYLSLFTGVTREKTLEYSYYFVPENDMINTSHTLFKFSSSRGILDASASGGENVMITFSTSGLNDEIKQYIDSKNVAVDKNDAFYYRIPEYANAEVIYNSKTYYKTNLLVNQFGLIAIAPLRGGKADFHTETGSLKSIELKTSD